MRSFQHVTHFPHIEYRLSKSRSNRRHLEEADGWDEFAKDDSNEWRPGALQQSPADRRRFLPMTDEEKNTYRKWRRAMLIFYGAFAFVIAGRLIVPLS